RTFTSRGGSSATTAPAPAAASARVAHVVRFMAYPRLRFGERPAFRVGRSLRERRDRLRRSLFSWHRVSCRDGIAEEGAARRASDPDSRRESATRKDRPTRRAYFGSLAQTEVDR